MASARPTLQLDDSRVIVTRWDFAPGDETGHHVHQHDYVVVPLLDGKLRLEEPEGMREAQLRAGVSYSRPAGIAHNVINANDFDFAFVEIELK